MKNEETSGLSCFTVKMLNAGAKLFQFVDDIRSCLKNYFLMNRFWANCIQRLSGKKNHLIKSLYREIIILEHAPGDYYKKLSIKNFDKKQ